MRALLRRSAGLAKSEIDCGPLRLDTELARYTVDGVPVSSPRWNTGCWPISCTIRGGWCHGWSWWSTFTSRISIGDFDTIEVFVGLLRKKISPDMILTVRGLAIASMRLNIKRNSLSQRLFFSSAIWTLLVLPFAAAVLISLYRDAVRAQLRCAAQSISRIPDRHHVTDARHRHHPASEPRRASVQPAFVGLVFGDPALGAPAQHLQVGVACLRNAQIAERGRHNPRPDGTAASLFGGAQNQELRVLEREITIIQNEQQRRYTYAVAGDAAESPTRSAPSPRCWSPRSACWPPGC